MRALLPEPVDDVDVHEHYARDWVDSRRDAGQHGGQRRRRGHRRRACRAGLQTPGDNRIFAALRDLADVVLVGAATALAEGYRPVAARRRAAPRSPASTGFAADLPIALVSRVAAARRDAPIFADPDAPPDRDHQRGADASRRWPASPTCSSAATSEIDFGEARRATRRARADPGAVRGRPDAARLRSLAAGELDELCLSVTPMLAGPAGGADRRRRPVARRRAHADLRAAQRARGGRRAVPALRDRAETNDRTASA